MISWQTEEWSVSRYNVLAENLISNDVYISDCTLREGEPQAGVVLSPKEKIHLAHIRDEIGIPQLEVGMPAVSNEEEMTISLLLMRD